MKTRYRTKRRENHIGMLMATVVVLLLTIVVSVRSVDLMQQVSTNNMQISELESQIEEEEQRSKEIDEFAKETQTRKYIEQVAREKLGLVYPGEIIFEKKSDSQ